MEQRTAAAVRCSNLELLYNVSQTIGEQLREARGARQITLEQAAKATHIRQRFLEALENDQWEILPSKVQGRGFLRLYADYLKLDLNALLNPPEITPLAPVEQPEPEDASEEISPLSHPTGSTVEPAAPPPPSGDQTFIEIGHLLRQRREAIGLSLTDVERYTKLRARYLQALEEGRLHDLPSPVQGRGMLNNYASFLGLNNEEILDRFADGLQSRLSQTRPSTQSASKTAAVKKNPPTGWRRIITFDVIVGVTLTFGLLIFAIWGVSEITNQQSIQQPTVPSMADAFLNTPTPELEITPTPTGTQQGTLQAQATATIPVLGSDPLQVYIIAHQRAFLQVSEDGKVAFSGRIVPGTAYPFTAINQIEIACGSSAAVQIYFNQTDMNLQGRLGEPLQLIFTAQGVITPTPLFTATPTATPQPTATLQPTNTQAAPTITPLIP